MATLNKILAIGLDRGRGPSMFDLMLSNFDGKEIVFHLNGAIPEEIEGIGGIRELHVRWPKVWCPSGDRESWVIEFIRNGYTFGIEFNSRTKTGAVSIFKPQEGRPAAVAT